MRSSPGYSLSENRIVVWCVRLQTSDPVLSRLRQCLNGDEISRADRYLLEDHRRSFAISRGVLRILIGRYLQRPPESLEFTYGPAGKPSIAGPHRIQLNASHSGNLALFAFALDCPIGVDIEQIRPLPDMHTMAHRFFAPEEAADLASLPSDQQQRAFFNCWTRKEAYIKATGTGLSTPLAGFAVTVRPAEAARLLHIAGDTTAAASWSLHDLAAPPGYAGALACPDSQRQVVMFPTINPSQLFLPE